jgi:FMN reductase [NAD(P)H]
MNATIQTITDHRSIRSYTDQPVSEDHLNAILAAAQAMPTSINGQQVSVVVVRDADRRAQIAELAAGNPWIAQAPVFLVFVADFHKTGLGVQKKGKTQVIHASAEGAVVATFDAGLAMGGAIVAAESLGLGIVPIGGIRKDPQGIIDLLGLPASTFPLAGLVIGHPADRSSQKPRMPRAGFAHPERYDQAAVAQAVETYDGVLADYYTKRGDKVSDWSTGMAWAYQQVYYPRVGPVLRSQGFEFKD